jgi:hypothetical protein
MIPSKKSEEKHPQNDESSVNKKPKKRLRKSPKRETGGATRTLEESRQTFYTHHERFIQGLACLHNIHPPLKMSP